MTTPQQQHMTRIAQLMLAVCFTAMVTLACLLMTGCATTNHEPSASSFPAGWEQACANGEASAVRWFRDKHGEQPANPHWTLDLVADSQLPGQGAHCVNAWRVVARRSTPDGLKGSYMGHENRHRLNKANNKLDTEETVR